MRENPLVREGLRSSQEKGVWAEINSLSCEVKEGWEKPDFMRSLMVRPLLFLNLISRKVSPAAQIASAADLIAVQFPVVM